jgi:hypothetical protein
VLCRGVEGRGCGMDPEGGTHRRHHDIVFDG